MTEEVWKTIPGYEGLYEISNLGRIKGLAHVRTIVQESMKLSADMKETLKLADGPSVKAKNKPLEGIVVKSHSTGQSFKVISNKWLEAHG